MTLITLTHATFTITYNLTMLLKTKCLMYSFSKDHTFLDLKVFGYLSYSSTLTSQWAKLNHRARKCVVLDFKIGTKCYVLYGIINHNTFISRHALFYDISHANNDYVFITSHIKSFLFDDMFMYNFISNTQNTTHGNHIHAISRSLHLKYQKGIQLIMFFPLMEWRIWCNRSLAITW